MKKENTFLFKKPVMSAGYFTGLKWD